MVENIEEYKSKYGDIYSITILDREYIYRTISIGEYHRIYSASRTDAEMEDSIVREALLYPEQDMPGGIDSSILAGIPTILANNILLSSNMDLSRWDTIVSEKKSNIIGNKNPSEDPIIGRIVTITEAFRYSPIELYDMDADQLLDLCAWAEVKLQVMNDVMNPKSNNMPSRNKSRIPDMNANVQPDISNRTKAKYTQVELEQMSLETSQNAIKEAMRGVRSRP